MVACPTGRTLRVANRRAGADTQHQMPADAGRQRDGMFLAACVSPINHEVFDMNSTTDSTLARDLIHEIIDLIATDQSLTDIHVEQDAVMMIKTPRGWREVGAWPVSEEEMLPLLRAIDEDWKGKTAGGAIDRPFDLTNCRLRCNVFRAGGGRKIGISIRRLPLQPIALDKIGLPAYVKTLLEPTKGVIFVTGPTGSGKTTTIASMLEHINNTRSAHIVTIEEPIEYQLQRRQSVLTQREVPSDTPSFYAGLREALRQKPDVIMVGEIRDLDTAETALHASESGHLVLASLHTNSAAGAISKLLSFFPSEQRAQRASALSLALIGVICQSLIPADGDDSFVLASEMIFNQNQQAAPFIADPGKLHMLADFMKRKEDNMSRTLNEDLAGLVAKKRISARDAIRAAYNRIELHDMINSRR
jgi:twitching motility protein PilT